MANLKKSNTNSKAIEFKINATRNNDFERKKITGSKEAEEYIRNFYNDDILIYESFFILLLDRENKVIGYSKISQGGVCGTVVDVKIILKYVIDSLASGVIITHNHPSGNTKPSEQDKAITSKIKEALKIIDSVLLDHLIITEKSYYSFSDNGLI